MTAPDLVLPVDLARYAAGNTGVPYFHRFASDRPGPRVTILALTHGNEWCGALALHHLFERGVRPARGTLTLGFANVAAAQTRASDGSGSRRYIDEDFNRLWTGPVLDGPRTSHELERARVIRPLIDDTDHLLDLHSMQTPSPPLALAGLADKGLALCRRLGWPSHIIRDAGHPEGARMRDYGAFARDGDSRSAVLVECGQHQDPTSVTVAIEVSYRFLDTFGLLRLADRPTIPEAPPATVITVTGLVSVQSPAFRFARDYRGLEVIEHAGTVVAWDGERAITTPHDDAVLIMPSPRIRVGQTALRFGRVAAP